MSNTSKQQKILPLYVVGGTGPSLLGRGWLEQINLKWGEIKHMKVEELTLQHVLAKHKDVFKNELGT